MCSAPLGGEEGHYSTIRQAQRPCQRGECRDTRVPRQRRSATLHRPFRSRRMVWRSSEAVVLPEQRGCAQSVTRTVTRGMHSTSLRAGTARVPPQGPFPNSGGCSWTSRRSPRDRSQGLEIGSFLGFGAKCGGEGGSRTFRDRSIQPPADSPPGGLEGAHATLAIVCYNLLRSQLPRESSRVPSCPLKGHRPCGDKPLGRLAIGLWRYRLRARR